MTGLLMLVLRRRTWHSLRIVDILFSFVLGRPKNLPAVGSGHSQMDIADQEDPASSQSGFSAVLKGSLLLEDIVHKLNGRILHVPTAEELLGRLRTWSQELPPTLRQFNFSSCDGSGLDAAERQLLTGNIHVSCVYYFAVMLTTRPYLVAYLLSRLKGRAPDQLISDPDDASDVNIKNSKISKMAQVCVSSAIYMVDMCQKVRTSNFVFGNMSLLMYGNPLCLCSGKSWLTIILTSAWIFGAGLVLGFSSFAGEPRTDIETGFRDARAILECISASNAQARLHHEILESFADAITEYHRRVAAERHGAVQHYIDQILVVNIPRSAEIPGDQYTLNNFVDANGDLDALMAGSMTALQDTVISTDCAQTMVGLSANQGLEDDWEAIERQLAHNDFSLDNELFEKLFYSIE